MTIQFKSKAKKKVTGTKGQAEKPASFVSRAKVKPHTLPDGRNAYSPFPDERKKAIIDCLEKVTASGRRPSQVFDDWVDLCGATMGAIPGHFQAWLEKKPFEDAPETKKLFERLRVIYQPKHFELFSQAFATLITVPDTIGYCDIVGEIYMDWGSPGRGLGQFFTPWHLTELMAKMLTGNMAEEINGNIKKAVYGNPLAEAMLMASYAIDDPGIAEAWFIGRLLPTIWDDVEKVKVSDPACGSGIMFLAQAAELPWWQVKMGMVQFYGMDIDRTCVQMATLNSRLYGLNGFYAPWIVLEMERRLRGSLAVGGEPVAGEEESEQSAVSREPEPPPAQPVSEERQMFQSAAAAFTPPMPKGKGQQMSLLEMLK